MLRAILVTLVLLSLTACGPKPDYWVDGLTLPPGSKVVSRTESSSFGAAAEQSYPMLGKFDKSLMVSFNNGGGWDKVAAHIDRCMKAQGYVESMEQANALISGIPGAKVPNTAGMDLTRSYTKTGSKYSVMLMSNADMAGAGGNNLADLGMGEFDLSILKFK